MAGIPTLGRGVELLSHALDYTGAVLSHLDLDAPPLASPTPCRDWDLGRLLAHMEDALDAFAEGARGEVDLDARVPVRVRTAVLREKACGLLVDWSRADGLVRVGDQELPAEMVALAASLEITVHGWDVAQAIGLAAPIPDRLADQLLTVAPDLVSDDDRVQRFGPARRVAPDAPPAARLLAFLGRDHVHPLAVG